MKTTLLRGCSLMMLTEGESLIFMFRQSLGSEKEAHYRRAVRLQVRQ